MTTDQFNRMADLLEKHLRSGLMPEEQQELDRWLSASEENRAVFARLDDPDSLRDSLRRFYQVRSSMRSKLERAVPELSKPAVLAPVRSVSVLRKWGWIAASLLLLMGAGAYFRNQQSQPPALAGDPKPSVPMDIEPGHRGAVLTLADGAQVVLDSLGTDGVIATQNGSKILLQGGQLAYDPTGLSSGRVTYNKIHTPKGRQFNVQLPDGTLVWLNAASSLRYPTSFWGEERRVEITGEAYFEIAKNARQPFRVNINNRAEVEVLGTHFNVNAYEDEESIRTTLVEGSISLALLTDREDSEAGQRVTLRPGQQARIPAVQGIIPASGEIKVLNMNKSDMETVTAWRYGAFNFNNASLDEVMKQLSRWYDIEVVYEKGVPDSYFMGGISRDVRLADLIKGLQVSGVHFRIEEGRRLVVMP